MSTVDKHSSLYGPLANFYRKVIVKVSTYKNAYKVLTIIIWEKEGKKGKKEKRKKGRKEERKNE